MKNKKQCQHKEGFKGYVRKSVKQDYDFELLKCKTCKKKFRVDANE